MPIQQVLAEAGGGGARGRGGGGGVLVRSVDCDGLHYTKKQKK